MCCHWRNCDPTNKHAVWKPIWANVQDQSAPQLGQREATFQKTCYNLLSFEIIDLLVTFKETYTNKEQWSRKMQICCPKSLSNNYAKHIANTKTNIFFRDERIDSVGGLKALNLQTSARTRKSNDNIFLSLKSPYSKQIHFGSVRQLK